MSNNVSFFFSISLLLLSSLISPSTLVTISFSLACNIVFISCMLRDRTNESTCVSEEMRDFHKREGEKMKGENGAKVNPRKKNV